MSESEETKPGREAIKQAQAACPCYGDPRTGPPQCSDDETCELHFHIAAAIEQAHGQGCFLQLQIDQQYLEEERAIWKERIAALEAENHKHENRVSLLEADNEQARAIESEAWAKKEKAEAEARRLAEALRMRCEFHHLPLINGWAHAVSKSIGAKTSRCSLTEAERDALGLHDAAHSGDGPRAPHTTGLLGVGGKGGKFYHAHESYNVETIHYRNKFGRLLWTERMIFNRLWDVGGDLVHDSQHYRVLRVALADGVQHVNVEPADPGALEARLKDWDDATDAYTKEPADQGQAPPREEET